jgi:hypothetical protein
MKKTMFLTAVVLALTGTIAGAQMMSGGGGMMQSSDEQQQEAPDLQQNNPCMMYPGTMGCYGMGPGMMGGYGMGPGMRGGYGMGPGMRGGYGYGMGPGMRGGYGMGPGMMGGYGYGMGPGMRGGYGHGPCQCGKWYDYGPGGPGRPDYMSPEEYQKFLDATKDLRKKLNDLQFEYGEMARNPKTTIEDRNKVEKEILDLQQKIREKAAQ